MSLKKKILIIPYLKNGVVFIYRLKEVLVNLCHQITASISWLYSSNETTNYTYKLDEINKRYLASLISDIMGVSFDIILSYMNEIEEDVVLKNHILHSIEKGGLSYIADKDIKFGRRVGWYAIARVLKPSTVVETGVDKGMGSCVLTSALSRNKEEGCPGYYYGTDINPDAGYMFTGEYRKYGTILYGDSIESLKKIHEKVDLFINDSDHSEEYEAAEYKAIRGKLSESAIILGDNSHCTSKLLDFSLEMDRNFVFFQEKPVKHWYSGAGIGISFIRKTGEKSD